MPNPFPSSDQKNTQRPLSPLGVVFFLLGGCSLKGTSNFPVAGAYFPGWLLCFFIALISAALLRALFLFLRVDAVLSFRLFTYLSLGAIIGLVTWMICFGP